MLLKSILKKDYTFWKGRECIIFKAEEVLEVDEKKALWLIKYKVAVKSEGISKNETPKDYKRKSRKVFEEEKTVIED